MYPDKWKKTIRGNENKFLNFVIEITAIKNNFFFFYNKNYELYFFLSLSSFTVINRLFNTVQFLSFDYNTTWKFFHNKKITIFNWTNEPMNPWNFTEVLFRGSHDPICRRREKSVLKIDRRSRLFSFDFRRFFSERNSMHLKDVAVVGDDGVSFHWITFFGNHDWLWRKCYGT